MQQRAQGVLLQDDLLQEKAKEIAAAANITSFASSNGWLAGFKKRFVISSKGLHGEAADADAAGVEHAQQSLPALLTELEYDKEDVF